MKIDFLSIQALVVGGFFVFLIFCRSYRVLARGRDPARGRNESANGRNLLHANARPEQPRDDE